MKGIEDFIPSPLSEIVRLRARRGGRAITTAKALKAMIVVTRFSSRARPTVQ